MKQAKSDNKKKPHFSWSQVSSYMRCGEAYRRRYIEGDICPPGIAAVRGQSVHKVAETNWKQKIESRQDIKKESMKEIAAETFDSIIRGEGVLLTLEEEGSGKAKILGQAKDDAVSLSDLYGDAVAPIHQPKVTETFQTVELPSSERDLLVKLDMITEKDEIQDLKTSTRSPNQDVADNSDQLTMYSLAFEAIYKKPPTNIIMDTLVKTKTPKHVPLTTKRTHEDFDVLVGRINRFFQGLKAGVFMPTDRSNWACSEKYCGYARTCPFYKKQHHQLNNKKRRVIK